MSDFLNRKSKCDIGKGFDLIVGSSTGAIIATALAYGISTSDIVRIYRESGPKIFSDPVPTRHNNWSFSPLIKWVIKYWSKPVNQSNLLRDVLSQQFDDCTLESLYETRNIRICIPGVNLANHKSMLFKTPHGKRYHHYPNYNLVDVCIAATAVPILFPVSVVNAPDDANMFKTFVDGSLWANNPILIALVEALSESTPEQEIHILSIGTCSPPGGTNLTKEQCQMGIRDWNIGMGIVNLGFEVQSYAYEVIANKLCRHLNRVCKIIRLPQTSPSASQSKYLQMDLASEESIRILTELAYTDAEYLSSIIMDEGNSNYDEVKDLFKKMPILAQ